MIFPQWAFFGLCTAALSATAMLIQERFKINGIAIALWNKIVCVIAMVPFIIHYGLPHEIRFYVLMALSALIYAISDVIYFSGISAAGAGTISRLMPISVIFSFLLWFAVDPPSFLPYLQKPIITALIFFVLCLWAYSASHLKKCAVSMKALQKIWFVIFANIIGQPIIKGGLDSTDIIHGIYGYPFVEGLMMLSISTIYLYARKPVTISVLFSRPVWRGSILFGAVNAIGMVAGALGFDHVDNPAYITALELLNSFLILLVYTATGRKNDGNVIAGIGMVACAAVLIILKAQV
jgi:hypothetical protein